MNWNEEQIYFYILSADISPIEMILKGFCKKSFKSNDIDWLDLNVKKFTNDAIQFVKLNRDQITILENNLENNFTILNDDAIYYYISTFSTLLEFFKTFRKTLS